MRHKTVRTKPERPQKSEAQRQAEEARALKIQRIQVTAGYIMVGVAVLGGIVMSLWPRAFGLRECNPAVGVGLAVLAAFRMYALRREVRLQGASEQKADVKTERSHRVAAKRA